MDQTRMFKRVFQAVALILILVFLSAVCTYYVDWLWFQSIGYDRVYITMLFSEWGLYAAVFLFGLLVVYFNLELARRHLESSPEELKGFMQEDDVIYLHPVKSPWRQFVEGPSARWSLLALSLVTAFLMAASTSGDWMIVQQYIHGQSFGIADPIFNLDISFYFFDLNFYTMIYNVLMAGLVISLLYCAALYLLNAGPEIASMRISGHMFAKAHMSALAALAILLKAAGYRLDAYELLFGRSGLVTGATYADVHARMLALKIMMGLAIVVAILMVLNIFVKRFRWVAYCIGAWLVLGILVGNVYPALVQNFIVKPNEFSMEQQYIEDAIKYTRQAYNLDNMETRDYEIKNNLDAQQIAANQATIDNIRLWDWQPLSSTYKSRQELKYYYIFNDIDIDRYVIDGKKRQVMIAAREMEDMEKNADVPAEAKTWVNQRLMFTHGFGVVMSPVNEVASDGMPNFFIKEIPPQSSIGMELEQPRIYFGESTDSYVIVNGTQEEFDYPVGETNMYTDYSGQNGLRIDSFARRMLFSWELGDYMLLFTSTATDDSQILMRRNIKERVNTLAPYLAYDNDPYIVIKQDDGKLYWIMDAYTTGDRYPYSQPYNDTGDNYLRNAVKIVIDAYSGQVDFYVADPDDPLMRTYMQIFPGMYKALDQMPAGLKPHIRYPADMFTIQCQVYATYHMTNPWVFYNKEDTWVIPKEIVGNQEQSMQPYYIIMRLPDAAEPEYILMLPYTPSSRPNMIAWMCARMDNDEYGRLLVYTFPKQQSLYGPMQVESRINQDTEISRQLSLWDQKGSSVYRGNLLVIPIGQSILYIEPLYLQASTGQMPEMKRVIATYGDKVVMEESLAGCLEKLFGYKAPGETSPPAAQPVEAPSGPQPVDTAASPDVPALIIQANQYYAAADQAAREGNWAAYGENLDRLGEVLQALQAAQNH